MIARLILPLVLAGSLLAGCVSPLPSPASADAATPVAPEPVAPDAPSVTLAGCLQHHTYYRNPVAPFSAFVPEGFRVATADPAGQLFDLRVATTLCENETVGEFWVTIPVIPPQGYATEGVVHELVPVEGHIQGETLLAAYTAWGFGSVAHAATLTFARQPSTSLAHLDSLEVAGEDALYVQRTALSPSEGVFAAEQLVLWAVDGGKATGRLFIDAGESLHVGAGATTLSYEGSGGAPPLATGIAHAVRDAAVAFHFEEVSFD